MENKRFLTVALAAWATAALAQTPNPAQFDNTGTPFTLTNVQDATIGGDKTPILSWNLHAAMASGSMTNLPGLTSWWRAQDYATNGAVATLPDLIGIYDLTNRGSAATFPATAVSDGVTALTFDGLSSYLNNTLLTTFQPHETIMLVDLLAISGTQVIANGTDSYYQSLLEVDNTGKVWMNDLYWFPSTSLVKAHQWIVLDSIWNVNHSDVYTNMVSVYSVPGVTGYIQRAGLMLGANYNHTANFANMAVAEAMEFNRILTPTARGLLYEYFRSRYPGANLPASASAPSFAGTAYGTMSANAITNGPAANNSADMDWNGRVIIRGLNAANSQTNYLWFLNPTSWGLGWMVYLTTPGASLSELHFYDSTFNNDAFKMANDNGSYGFGPGDISTPGATPITLGHDAPNYYWWKLFSTNMIGDKVQLHTSTAPTVTGNDVVLWNSNKVIYAVSATKINLISDLR